MYKGHQDNTAVMDWYANEIKDLATGNGFFCGSTNYFKHVSMGLIAYLANRLETCSLLKEMIMGSMDYVPTGRQKVTIFTYLIVAILFIPSPTNISRSLRESEVDSIVSMLSMGHGKFKLIFEVSASGN